MNTLKRITIIGGGASGALASLHCWLQMGPNIEMTVIDPSSHMGYGLAYTTVDTDYLLNVPAGNMSAFPHKPSDFEAWVEQFDAKIRESTHWPYVPRKYFGMYLESRIKEIPAKNLKHIQSKVLSINEESGQFYLKFENQSIHGTDHLIVATGYAKESTFSGSDKIPFHPRIVPASTLEEVHLTKISGHVLIVGSGLTGIDVWRRLTKQSTIQSLSFLSRRGLFPESHQENRLSDVNLPSFLGKTPIQTLRLARKMNSESIGWPQIANKVRENINEIWQSWDDLEKRQFLRHLKPFWEVIRHRMPATITEELKQEIFRKRAQVFSGRINNVQDTEGELIVTFRDRTSLKNRVLQTDWIVLATGSAIDQSLFKETPIQGVHCCPYGFGFSNTRSENIWFIGPSSKSSLWEVTSIPDIRLQAAAIAKSIDNAKN